jgi:hypothetical protein
MFGPIPNGGYEIVSFATDEQRRNVTAYAVFHGTHSWPSPADGEKGRNGLRRPLRLAIANGAYCATRPA